MDNGKIFLYVLTMLFGVGLYYILQNYVIALDTSAWTFTGASFIIAVMPILPTLFLVTLIIIPVYFIVEEVQE